MKKAIIFPSNLKTMAAIARINAGMNTSGTLEIDDREVIIDCVDLSLEFKILTLQDYIIFNNRRFEIKRLTLYDNGLAYYIIMREFKTQGIRKIVNLKLKSLMPLQQIMEVSDE